jgi:hypothetical protein
MNRIYGAILATVFFLAIAFSIMPAATADDRPGSRAKAAQETREALKAYRDALQDELRQLESWAKTVPPAGGEKLREEREIAKKKLEALADEAKHTWESIRARMDSVVEDMKRQEGQARAAK